MNVHVPVCVVCDDVGCGFCGAPSEPWPAETFADLGFEDLRQLVADASAELARRIYERRAAALNLNSSGDGRSSLDGVGAAVAERRTIAMDDDDAGRREPTDDEIYNRSGVEGGIAYDPADEPGSLGENDWRL